MTPTPAPFLAALDPDPPETAPAAAPTAAPFTAVPATASRCGALGLVLHREPFTLLQVCLVNGVVHYLGHIHHHVGSVRGPYTDGGDASQRR